MAKTNNTRTVSSDVKEVTLRWKMFVDGVGLVFAGVMSMLEALDPDTVKDLLDGHLQIGTHGKDVDDATEKTRVGSGDADPDGSLGGVDVAAGVDHKVETGPAHKEDATPETSAAQVNLEAQGVTLDDVTKIIVQKIKQSRSNNVKIGSILKTYGVAKVSDLPTEKYEAFLTDLAQL